MSKILIIEDDEAIASIERDYLEIDNFEVEIASNGIDGLKRGESGEFDLILLELTSPSSNSPPSIFERSADLSFPSSLLILK